MSDLPPYSMTTATSHGRTRIRDLNSLPQILSNVGAAPRQGYLSGPSGSCKIRSSNLLRTSFSSLLRTGHRATFGRGSKIAGSSLPHQKKPSPQAHDNYPRTPNRFLTTTGLVTFSNRPLLRLPLVTLSTETAQTLFSGLWP